MRHAAAWLLPAVILLLARPASAEDALRIYAVGYTSTEALEVSAREVEGLARAALAEAEGFEWRQADLIMHGDVQEAQGAYRRALRRMGRGRQAYLNFQLEQAVESLEAALQDFDAAAQMVCSPELVAQTLMFLGASHVLLGDVEKATQLFTTYHERFWDVAPDGSAFNPEIMAHWERAGEEVMRAQAGTIEVTSEPGGAWVSVDGRVRARTPATVSQVAPGEHVVRVQVDGRAPVVERVQVVSGETVNIAAGALTADVQLAQQRGSIASSDGSPDAETALATARQLKIDQLLLFEVAPGLVEEGLSVSMYLLDAKDGHVIAQLQRDVGGLLTERAAAVRKLVASALDKAVAHVRKPPAVAAARVGGFDGVDTSGGTESNKKESGGKGWIWGVAAGGVAVVGGVIAAVLLSGDDDVAPAGPPDDQAGLTIVF